MVIAPSAIHEDHNRAWVAVASVCQDLGILCNLKLQSMWMVKVTEEDRENFLKLCMERAKNLCG